MTATQTVSQRLALNKTLKPTSHGVLTLFGYGIQVRVDRCHLLVDDGVGSDRYQVRLPRVGHGLRRLVVIGNDGMISLAALRWLSDQDVTLLMLERNGQVLTTTGPVHSSDARLRRAQGLAHESGAALVIARELISKKLAGQEQVVRDKLLDLATADVIAGFRGEVERAESIDAVRWTEARAAAAYWTAWHDLLIGFPKGDLRRVPDHWRVFGGRASPITRSQRLAVNPPNAILNYLYALLESEARLSAAALGLDPGLGVLHYDAPGRDSLACDLMEPVRPQIDAFVLDWITRQALLREWFFEERNGNCRLMADFAARLSETAPTWGRAVASYAEWTARTLWSRRKRISNSGPATPLTQQRRREAKGRPPLPLATPAPRPSVCRTCGTSIPVRGRYCGPCGVAAARERLRTASHQGREKSQGEQAQTKRAESQRRHMLARSAWEQSKESSPITEEDFLRDVQPRLAAFRVGAICSALDVSKAYASAIRTGKLRPHPRHWQALAEVVGIAQM